MGDSQPPMDRGPIFLSDSVGIHLYVLVNKIDRKNAHRILKSSTGEREVSEG